MILTLLIVIPAIGGLLAWVAARWSVLAARWISLVACAVDLVIALYLWAANPSFGTMGAPFLQERTAWVPQLGISYHLAMDGLSLLLVILASLLGVVSVAASWKDINDRVGAFHFSLLLLLSGILGVFLAYDLLLFYFLWEIMLVPMYFLIGLWGHEDRIRAAIKFFLFTFISGLFMLAAIVGLYIVHGRATGHYTFDYLEIMASPGPARYSIWLMLGFFLAFATKLPIVPLHTWLPDAHTEAPTAGSVILAGLMLKTGAYGLMRFAIPLFPEASTVIVPAALILGALGVIYGAIQSFAQNDMKRMVAYTSVSHMGFVLLGIYAGNQIALQGATVEIICHGIATGGLFLIVGMIQERTHTRDLNRLGGLWATMPKLGGFTLLFALAALGLPGLGNFIGEFLVLLGAFRANPVVASVAAVGLVFSVIYALRLVQRSVLGPNEHNWSLPNLNARESAILGVLAVVIVWLGLYPRPIFNTARASLTTVQESLPDTGAQEVRGAP